MRSKKLMVVAPRKWLNTIRRKFLRSSERDIIFLHSNTSPAEDEDDDEEEEAESTIAELPPYHQLEVEKKPVIVLTKEDIAAIKIQACFRAHLARRAFRALKSLVKLQAVARGVCVRRQASIALRFMHALVQLQVRVRVRQLLINQS